VATEQPRALALGCTGSKTALKAPPTPRMRGAIRTWRRTPTSNTPSLRVAGFEDEDEDEYEAPHGWRPNVEVLKSRLDG
jgi:hypothetical protein